MSQVIRATLQESHVRLWFQSLFCMLLRARNSVRRKEASFKRKRLTNTPVRQAGSVLKCPEDRQKRVVSAQATYPCGSSRRKRCVRFPLGRGRDRPKRFLEQFEGILQTDGYAAYDQIGGPRMVHAACWSHAGRQFFEAVQLNPRDPVATPIVAQVDELFAVDAEARRKTLTTAACHIQRKETARPLLNDIRSKIEAAQSAALPSSALGNACQYALALWKKLTRFLEYPELELSTNLAENSMPPVALGRKNWSHIGSPQAEPKAAAVLSVVESCRRLQVPVRDYFSTVLPGLADLPIRCLPDLTPRCVGRPAFIDASDRGKLLPSGQSRQGSIVYHY